jgi:DNA-binding Lrp family transcriptional regulator
MLSKENYAGVIDVTRLSEEEKQYLRYQIYSLRYDDPWISNKKVAKRLNRSISTVDRYAKEAEQNMVILGPEIRLRPTPERRAALLLLEDKYKAYDIFEGSPTISYQCIYQGGWDMVVTYKDPMDLTKIPGYKGKIANGLRGTVISPKVEYTSWRYGFEKMEKFMEQKKDIDKSRLQCVPCQPEWDEEEWTLYYYFKRNLRRNFNRIRKEHKISWRKYEDWKASLKKYCSINLLYLPEGYDAYRSVSLCLETDYEQYLVDLLSLLPTGTIFYKIGERLMATIYTPREDAECTYRIFRAISQLKGDGIVNDCLDGFAMWYWRRHLSSTDESRWFKC